MLLGYAGKELVKLSTVLPQGLATLPLRANQDLSIQSTKCIEVPLNHRFCVVFAFILS